MSARDLGRRSQWGGLRLSALKASKGRLLSAAIGPLVLFEGLVGGWNRDVKYAFFLVVSRVSLTECCRNVIRILVVFAVGVHEALLKVGQFEVVEEVLERVVTPIELVEKFLRVRAGLRRRARAYMHLHLAPLLSVQLKRLQKLKVLLLGPAALLEVVHAPVTKGA